MKTLTKNTLTLCILGLLLQPPLAGAAATQAVSTPIPENDPQLTVGRTHAHASEELIQVLETNLKTLEQAIAELESCDSLTGPGAGGLGHARYLDCRIGQLEQVRQVKQKTAKELTAFADKIKGSGAVLDKAKNHNARNLQGLEVERRQTELTLKRLKERAQTLAPRLGETGELPPEVRMELLKMSKEILAVKQKQALITAAQRGLSGKGERLDGIKANIGTWEGEARVIAYGYELEAGTLADAIRYAGMEGGAGILISQFDNPAAGRIGDLLKQINGRGPGPLAGKEETTPTESNQPSFSLIGGDTDLIRLIRDFAQEQ